MLRWIVLLFGLLGMFAGCAGDGADTVVGDVQQLELPEGYEVVLADDAYLVTPIGNLANTDAVAEVVDVEGQGFGKALMVDLKKAVSETNATQLVLNNEKLVEQGDGLIAEIWVKGEKSDGTAAQVTLMFEKSSDPWTKSITQAISAPAGGGWKKTLVAFDSAETYQPGEAMLSVRLAFGVQKVWLGGIRLVNYKKTKTLNQLLEIAAMGIGGGEVTLTVDKGDVRQEILGLGGNFCQPRYGRTEAMDSVGKYALENLNVEIARVGLPLDYWAPERGKYVEAGQAEASLKALKQLSERGIPVIVSVWEAKSWLLPGEREGMGRELPRENYVACAEAIGAYLKLAQEKYGVDVPYFSFNEPDYGVNFKFDAKSMAEFIKVAMPIWKRMGLKTKFLTADTANGRSLVAMAEPLLQDAALRESLGPIAFHSWDAMDGDLSVYRGIAALGKKYGKDVWCTEAGHDAQLWQKPNPWASWENGLRTAVAYARVMSMTGSSAMVYWTYQDNYPLVNGETVEPYAVFGVMRQMESVFKKGWHVVGISDGGESLDVVATSAKDGSGIGVLIANRGATVELTLKGLSPGAVKVVVSDAEAQEVASEGVVSEEGEFRVTVPVRSVVTVIR